MRTKTQASLASVVSSKKTSEMTLTASKEDTAINFKD
jgi:hypothetical protein